MKYFLLIVIPLLLLSSCTQQQDGNKNLNESNTNTIITPSNNIILKVGSTGDIVDKKSSSGFSLVESKSSTETKSAELTIQQKIAKDPTLLTIEDIKAIKTIDDLSVIYPGIENSDQKENPDFILLQRNQILLSRYLTQISDPEYQKLHKELQELQDGKAIWPLEIRLAHKASEDYMSSSGKLQINTNDKDNPLIIRNILIAKFKESSEYSEYINNSQGRFKELALSMRKYWTPELISLEKEIQKLNKKIYGSR